MPGLFDRVHNSGNDRIDVHLLIAGLGGYAFGMWTAQQILDALNSKLASPLAGLELTDLTAIRTAIDAITAGNTDVQEGRRMVRLRRMELACIAAENGLVNEVQWRAGVGI